MTKYCTDYGYRSLIRHGEELCGDHVEQKYCEDGSFVSVLADGLGSGVKANILSTLTSKIISTMLAEGMSVENCIETVASTLPVCSERKVAYSTFTAIRTGPGETAELIQYDNPRVIFFRDGESVDYPYETVNIGGKTILCSRLSVRDGDIFVAMSDGVIHAGTGMNLNYEWDRDRVIEYLKPLTGVGFTAKTLSSVLADECYSLYEGEPGDDTTVCCARIRQREPVSLVIGPPSDRSDCGKMMSLFFSKGGKHIVCGGTTSEIAAEYLGKPLVPELNFADPQIPPTSKIEGVDLVTEGVITINRVLSYAEDYLADNESYRIWSAGRDGASLIARMLFEEATDINFFVGKAINPAHQNSADPISFNVKMRLVNDLAECLRKMGKRIKVSYF